MNIMETLTAVNFSTPKPKPLEHTICFIMESTEYTVVPVKPYQFDWHVPTEFLLPKQQDPNKNADGPICKEFGYMSSPTYRAVENSTSKWCMKLSKTHNEPNGSGFVSLFLFFKGFEKTPKPESPGTEINVLYSFQIMLKKDIPVISRGSGIRRFNSTSMDSRCFGWDKFCDLHPNQMNHRGRTFFVRLNLWIIDHCLSAVTSLDPLLPVPGTAESGDAGDSFTDCQNTIYGGGDHSNASSASRSREDDKPTPKLVTDHQNLIKHIWMTKFGWDVELTADDYSFQAHSTILTARSNLLARELPLCPKNENGKRVCKLGSMDPEMVHAMLEYSYTAETTAFQDFQTTLQLFEAAAKLEMKALKNRCVRELVNRLDQLSLLDVSLILQLFDKYPPELEDSKTGLKQLGNYVWKNLLELKKRAELKELFNGPKTESLNPTTKNNFVQTILFKSFL